jgi:hypothetical protein
VLAAFLGQPVVIAGHHYDARNHLAALAEIAATVNGFGPVEWCNLTRIARTQYKTRRDGDDMMVRLGSRRVTVRVSEGVRSITVERPWLNQVTEERLVATGVVAGEKIERMAGSRSERIPVNAPGIVELVSPAPTALTLADAPVPRRRIWPLLRRVLTETRDRAYPYLAAPVRKRDDGNGSSSNSFT